MTSRPLPLDGVKAISLASLGPGPYAAMLLADLGCEVTIIDRIDPVMTSLPLDRDPRRRGQRSIAVDVRKPQGLALLQEMIAGADILMEGMRPGTAEKLGLSPAHCAAINPGLIYARISGWGQDGPLSRIAGHDINYIALSGALHAMGDPDRPPPVPLNLLGDYAGGGLYAALGIVSALFERVRSGRGQVIDSAMADGIASLSAATLGAVSAGLWGGRGENVLGGGAPFYRSYETSDGGFMAVGAIEPQFFARLLEGLGLDPARWSQNDRSQWPAMQEEFARIFAARPRAHWEAAFAGTDACASPVLTFEEAPAHPQHRERATYTSAHGMMQPSPGPRMGAHQPQPPGPAPDAGADTGRILAAMGRTTGDIAALRAGRIVK